MEAKRRFEFVEGSSRKFWETWCVGNEVHTQYGKIGAAGQSTVKTESDAAAAAKLLGKLVAEKTKKGYVEVGAAGSEPTPPPAGKVTKPSAKAGKSPAAGAQERSSATPLDLVELMIEQIAKHKRFFRDELEILGNHAATASQPTVLGWLAKIPEDDGWRCGGAARIAIALFYAGETERAKELLGEARANVPAEAPTHWEAHHGVTHAHVALAAAELLLDPAAGQTRLERLRAVEGSPGEHATLILSTLLIGRQWTTAETAAKAVEAISFNSTRYFRYAISCALRCDQHDLVGKLLSALEGDNSHEAAASMVYEHSLRWKRPQDLLELCLRFPETFMEQYVLDALVDCALVDRDSAARFAEKISNLRPPQYPDMEVILGCALYRFRGDPEGGARFLTSRTDESLKDKERWAPLPDAIAGDDTSPSTDWMKMGRFRWTKELAEKELLPNGRLNEFTLNEVLRNMHQLVRIGAGDTAREQLPKLLEAIDKVSKGDRGSVGEHLGYLAGLLRDAKLGDTASKLVTARSRVQVLKEVVAGAVEVGDWDSALRVAEKTPDSDLNDRQNMVCNALSGTRRHVRYFCTL